MDCLEFEEIVVDLARGERGAEGCAERARAHADECENCAARLAAEERLLAGFAALRDEDRPLQPTARLDALLLEEFAKRRLAEPAAVRDLRRLWSWWAASAAAAVVVAVWLGPWGRPPSDGPGGVQGPGADSAREATGPAAESTERALAGPPAEIAPEAAKAGERPSGGVEHGMEKRQTGGGPSQSAETPLAVEPQPQVEAAGGPAVETARSEIATDFVPLTSSAWASPTMQARLVRVRLPSSALLYFGLPAGNGTSTVEADIVLGVDGLAHAVRFVRPAFVTASTARPVSRTSEPH